MKTLMASIDDNVANGYSKTYASRESAERSIARAEKKLNIVIDAFYVLTKTGRIAVAINANRSHSNDRSQQGFEMTSLVHGTNGWLVYN